MDFVQAVEDIPKIRNQDCRDWAMKNYSESVVHQKFDRHLQYISSKNFYHGKNTQPS
jgi:hypothetical protein